MTISYHMVKHILPMTMGLTDHSVSLMENCLLRSVYD